MQGLPLVGFVPSLGAALRSLTGDARKKVKALAQSEGVERALKLARSLAKK